MKAITLYEPWASLCILGFKKIETRKHDRFRKLKDSRILIHAAKEYDDSTEFLNYLNEDQIKEIERLIETDHFKKTAGKLIGSVIVFDTGRLNERDSPKALIDCSDGRRYGLFLASPVMFKKFISYKGQRSIFNVPDVLISQRQV